mmetsp:Transcript_1570/g.4764  ORF Transcript_1570/g.4764 Transcript_1570/m.4764 type:complete len:153 (+) Transcript_1570:38-496(+)
MAEPDQALRDPLLTSTPQLPPPSAPPLPELSTVRPEADADTCDQKLGAVAAAAALALLIVLLLRAPELLDALWDALGDALRLLLTPLRLGGDAAATPEGAPVAAVLLVGLMAFLCFRYRRAAVGLSLLLAAFGVYEILQATIFYSAVPGVAR